jgi:hypothetical protein
MALVSKQTQPTKVAGKLRRAVRSSRFAGILGGRHMACAYYFNFCRLCQNKRNTLCMSFIAHFGLPLDFDSSRSAISISFVDSFSICWA